jgi:copper resistance protein B
MNTSNSQGKHMNTLSILAASVLVLGAAPTLAIAAGAQGQHVMEAAGAKPESGASPMKQAAAPAAMPMGAMDHGDMNMQGGSAPADARDPHAYSGGYTLDSGKYALAGPRQLRLADEHSFGTLLVDRLERVDTRDATSTAFDAQAWFGRDYDRLVVKAEGDYANGRLEEARTELLWGHAIASYWDAQLGLRYDTGEGPDRSWLAFGIQGLAPYWFELDATAYVGNEGRSALRVEAEYELPITQRLVLQPRGEINVYGKKDEANGMGSGLTDATFGLRLRYEVSRQFAPYIGVEWNNKFGQTADLARAEGASTRETRWVAGLRFWF